MQVNISFRLRNCYLTWPKYSFFTDFSKIHPQYIHHKRLTYQTGEHMRVAIQMTLFQPWVLTQSWTISNAQLVPQPVSNQVCSAWTGIGRSPTGFLHQRRVSGSNTGCWLLDLREHLFVWDNVQAARRTADCGQVFGAVETIAWRVQEERTGAAWGIAGLKLLGMPYRLRVWNAWYWKPEPTTKILA